MPNRTLAAKRTKSNSRQIGRAGELYLQFLLLRAGVESSELTTDEGVDLVAFSPRRRRAYTIQVKTNLAPKPAGGQGKPALDWWVPDDCPADFVACVDLSGPRAWLFRFREFARVAQQHSSGRYHLYMWCQPDVTPRSDRRSLLEQFTSYDATRRIRRALLWS